MEPWEKRRVLVYLLDTIVFGFYLLKVVMIFVLLNVVRLHKQYFQLFSVDETKLKSERHVPPCSCNIDRKTWINCLQLRDLNKRVQTCAVKKVITCLTDLRLWSLCFNALHRSLASDYQRLIWCTDNVTGCLVGGAPPQPSIYHRCRWRLNACPMMAQMATIAQAKHSDPSLVHTSV